MVRRAFAAHYGAKPLRAHTPCAAVRLVKDINRFVSVSVNIVADRRGRA
jgi:hypothetical protein